LFGQAPEVVEHIWSFTVVWALRPDIFVDDELGELVVVNVPEGDLQGRDLEEGWPRRFGWLVGGFGRKNSLTSNIVIPNAYTSDELRGDPPLSRSGAIQLRLPAIKLWPGPMERLVTSAFIRESPKSHKTARLPSSMRTFN
jgi:hypothetical protein